MRSRWQSKKCPEDGVAETIKNFTAEAQRRGGNTKKAKEISLRLCTSAVHSLYFNAASIRSHKVFKILIRAKFLSLASTRIHGDISELVRSTMSQTAIS